MKLLMATNNKGKALELKAVLKDTPFEVLSLKEAGFEVEVDEDGHTFIENAIKKAKETYRATGVPSVGDDSGLEVYALNGAPGIYSARWAGGHGEQDLLIEKLMKELQGKNDRRARFTCAVALALSEEDIICAEGYCEGVILNERRGNGGFGYDPVFYVESKKKTFAELTADEKNQISHRSMALKNLKSKLSERGVI
ncbi:MAG: XTP/dITP diphosphatase [Bacillota bacterium]|nr:XTP/dITP diphosphatase [Bacillota bacterium]